MERMKKDFNDKLQKFIDKHAAPKLGKYITGELALHDCNNKRITDHTMYSFGTRTKIISLQPEFGNKVKLFIYDSTHNYIRGGKRFQGQYIIPDDLISYFRKHTDVCVVEGNKDGIYELKFFLKDTTKLKWLQRLFKWMKGGDK